MSRSPWEPPDPAVHSGPPAPQGVPPPVPEDGYPPRPVTPPPGYPPRPVTPPPGYPPRPVTPPSGYPPAGYMAPQAPQYRRTYPSRPVGLPRPLAVDPVPGTPFGVAIVEVRPTTSGPASASLVVGIVSIMVSLIVACFALIGADAGWGPPVAGAFAVLSALTSFAAIWLCWTGLRRIRRTVGWGAVRGRGLAIAGLTCGLVGFAITALVMAAALAR
jgi:hypothetical protein